MRLYEVIFWGSHRDRPHKDTIYLVRAEDFKGAVEEVSTNASPINHGGKRFPLAHAVYEVGSDLSPSAAGCPRILRGPYFESAYNHGWKAWHRKLEGSDYTREWEEETSAA
jgi:hypothetical protein